MQKSNFKNTLVEDLKVWGVDVSVGSSFWKMFKHTIYCLIFYPGFACVVFYRINVWLDKKIPILAKLLGSIRYYKFANDISYKAVIGPGLKISHISDIVIGANVTIGRNARIYNGVTLGAKNFNRTSEQPTVGDNFIAGTGAKILGPITIGDNVSIGAITFCDKSVPSNSTAFGNPMVIKENS